MHAIFLSGNICTSYKEIEYEGEEETFLIEYVLVDELPDIIENTPENHYVEYKADSDEFVLIKYEIEPEPPNRIDELEESQANQDTLIMQLLLGGM